jgi:arylsulfatase A-like enzyme
VQGLGRQGIRETALKSCVLLLAWSAFLLAGCSRPRDNVVVVVIDTVRRDHLATYGYARDTAPFLDRLARQGAAFEGLSPSSWTKPAVASLFSGLHPVRHRVFDRFDQLPLESPLLAERLRRVGYHTLGATTNGWTSPLFGFDRGFERYLLYKEMKGKDLNQRLFPLLDRLRPPFFLFVHYLDPHAPFDPDIGWDGRPLPPSLRAQGPVTLNDLDAAHFRQRPAELLDRTRDLYDGEIREADDALRELVTGLARRGLMDSTVLVVASDHGEELQDHGRMGHGQTLYQEVLEVPLVIHAPHRFQGGLRLGRASLLDVVPTLEDWLGLESAEAAFRPDGLSLAPVLRRRNTARPENDRAFLAHLDFEEGVALALLKGHDKVVLAPQGNELFDLRNDPHEHRNLLVRPAVMPHFARLGAAMVSLYNSYSKTSLQRSSVESDAGLQQSLAALGYVAPNEEVPRRVIPRRLELPAFGWLSWKPFSSGSNCAHLAEEDADRYLLQGWYAPEQGGRWSERRASLAMSAVAGEQENRLVLIGINHRSAPVRLRVDVEQKPVLESAVALGPFQLSVEVPGEILKARSRVVLETDSAFIPSQHGGVDSRSLGLFWIAVCRER